MAHLELRVFCGADSNFLAWRSSEKVEGCLGYALKRRVDGGPAEPLTAYVGFSTGGPAKPNQQGEPCTRWPFQRFTWSDFEPHTGKVEYQAVAIVGAPATPKESDLVSAWVSPTPPEFGDFIPFFNFASVSSRWFSTMAELYPTEFATLRTALSPAGKAKGLSPDKELHRVLQLSKAGPGGGAPTIGEELGAALSKRVKQLLSDALADGAVHIYAALFELSDPDLIAGLKALGQRCHLVLANGTHENGVDENAAAAAELAGAVDLHRRELAKDSVYAHNKFVVVAPNNVPLWAWTGSTNWSPHGLYTQANNGLEVRHADIARAYFEEWQRLKAAADTTPPPAHPPAQDQYHFENGGVSASVFFSPHPLPKADGAKSPDLTYANALIRGAKQGILSLMLDPGWTGSLLQTLRATSQAQPDLYVRAVINSDPTQHAKDGDPTAVGFLHGHEAVPSNYDIVLPADQRQPGEPIEDYLGRVGIVVVHSKVIVIDPLGDHPVVMTGSHNMGVKAATINDDNLIIIEGDQDLAVAYALNVMSVFNHFWWRHNMASPAKKKAARAAATHPAGFSAAPTAAEWTGLQTTDAWQTKFYSDPNEANEARFWGVKG